MEEVTVTEFKATCLRIIERVRLAGVSILLTKNGRPAAVLSPPPSPQDHTVAAGALKGRAKVLGDIIGPVADGDWDALK